MCNCPPSAASLVLCATAVSPASTAPLIAPLQLLKRSSCGHARYAAARAMPPVRTAPPSAADYRSLKATRLTRRCNPWMHPLHRNSCHCSCSSARCCGRRQRAWRRRASPTGPCSSRRYTRAPPRCVPYSYCCFFLLILFEVSQKYSTSYLYLWVFAIAASHLARDELQQRFTHVNHRSRLSSNSAYCHEMPLSNSMCTC